LIGGLALAALGVPRGTADVDLLVEGGDRAAVAREALASAGFTVFHESAEVLQATWSGRALDCLFANRPPTRAMLAEARALGDLGVPCCRAEDVIGLKIQAYKNDPVRALRDQADIVAIAHARPDLDWERVRGYAERFGEWEAIRRLCARP
jgi:hypothetical protein